MKFTPFKFQVPLAAGGIALMAFNYLQFAVPHGKGLIKLSDIPWDRLTAGQTALYLPLIGIMSVFVLINFIFTLVFLKMLPALVFYGFLWVALFVLEFKFLKNWLTKPLDSTKLNFVWLLDVFAFGLVNLTGTGIASMSSSKEIASIAAFASFVALSVGVFLLVAKLGYLLYLQIKSTGLPSNPVLPSFFSVIPITCLFGISFDRIALFAQRYYKFDIEVLSFFLINLSYVITVGWGIFTIYLLSSYFKEYFYKSEFAAPQWAMV